MKFINLLFMACASLQTVAAADLITFSNVEDGLCADLNYADLTECPQSIVIPDEAPDPSTGIMTPVVEIGMFSMIPVESVIFGSNIVRISSGAFMGCTELKNVGSGTGFSLPASVQSIGDSAFTDCSSLFADQDNVEVNVPEIHALAFANTGLHNFTFGPDVRVTSLSVVNYNADLESVTFAKALSEDDKLLIEGGGYRPGYEDTPIPVIYLNRPLFSENNPELYVTMSVPGLEEVHAAFCTKYSNFFNRKSYIDSYDLYIGPGVESVGSYTICRNLYAENASDLKKISNVSLSGAREDYNLDLSTFPALAEISDCFSGDQIGYSTVTLPSTLTYLGSSFQGARIDTMIIPDGPEMEVMFNEINVSKLIVDRNADSHCSINEISSRILEYGPNVRTAYGYPSETLEKVVFPDNVTEIYANAFDGCSALNEIEGGINVTSIGANAFSGCSSLESFTLSKDLTAIHDYAFAYTAIKSLIFYDEIHEIPNIFGWEENSSLLALSFGSGLEEIECTLFMQKTGLSFLRNTALTPASVKLLEYHEDSFDFDSEPFTTCTFCCPAESYDAYKSAPFWEHFLVNRHRVNMAIDGMDGCCSIVVTGNAESRADNDGSVTIPVGGNEVIATPENGSITIQFDIPDGGQLKSFEIDGVDMTSKIVNNRYTLTDIRDDKNVSIQVSDPLGISMPKESGAWNIITSDGSIHINGAEGKSVTIYSIDGIILFATNSYCNETISGLNDGIYIVTVDGEASKCVLR